MHSLFELQVTVDSPLVATGLSPGVSEDRDISKLAPFEVKYSPKPNATLTPFCFCSKPSKVVGNGQ